MITKFKIFEKIIEPSENRLTLDFTIEEFRDDAGTREIYQNIINVTDYWVFGGTRGNSFNIGIITLLQNNYITSRECVNFMLKYSTEIWNNNNEDDNKYIEKIVEGINDKTIKLNLSDVNRIILDLHDIWPSLVVNLSELKYPKIWLKEYVQQCESDYTISEVGYYKLYKNGIISKQKFVECFSDLYVKDDKIVFVVDDFEELEFVVNKSDRKQVMEILGDGSNYHDMGYSLDDIDWVWNYITLETKRDVVNLMEGIEFGNEELDSLEVFDKKNVYEKNNDLYYKFKEDFTLRISKIIEDGKKDEFEDLWDKLDSGYSDANEADYNKLVYQYVKDGFSDALGHFEEKIWKEYINDEGKEIKEFKLVFDDINLDLLTDMDYELDYRDDSFSSWRGVLLEAVGNELEEIKYDFNEDFSPYPSNEELDYYVKNQLNN